MHERLMALRVERKYGQIGAVGERVFAAWNIEQGRAVASVHKGGVDFRVDQIPWDVKTRSATLDQYSGARFNRVTRPRPGTHFAYLVLYRDCAMLYLDDEVSCAATFTWKQLTGYASRDISSLPKYEENTVGLDRRAVAKNLKQWIFSEFTWRARIIYRSGMLVQDGMERGGWGADSFYLEEGNRSKYDLVVLLFFEDEEIYKIYAYPVSEIRSVDFKPRRMDKNASSARQSFDPRSLDPRFKFSGIKEFKATVLKRFGSAASAP